MKGSLPFLPLDSLTNTTMGNVTHAIIQIGTINAMVQEFVYPLGSTRIYLQPYFTSCSFEFTINKTYIHLFDFMIILKYIYIYISKKTQIYNFQMHLRSSAWSILYIYFNITKAYIGK